MILSMNRRDFVIYHVMKHTLAYLFLFAIVVAARGQGSKIYPVKYKIRKGDTINYVDRNGLRQGRHYVGDTLETDYLEDRAIKETHLYPDGKVRLTLSSDIGLLQDDFQFHSDSLWRLGDPPARQFMELDSMRRWLARDLEVEYFYYASGAMRKECESKLSNGEKITTCKEWDKNGKLIKP